MQFTPVNTHTERRGNRVRLYSQPKFVRPDGITWRPIEEVVSVTRDKASGAYRVTCGSEWITFSPRKRQGKLIESVVSAWHFGDILTPNSGYDSVVEYDIAYSSRVKHTTVGWQFAGITDVAGGECSQGAGRAEPFGLLDRDLARFINRGCSQTALSAGNHRRVPRPSGRSEGGRGGWLYH